MVAFYNSDATGTPGTCQVEVVGTFATDVAFADVFLSSQDQLRPLQQFGDRVTHIERFGAGCSISASYPLTLELIVGTLQWYNRCWMLMLDGLLCLLMILMAFIVEAALAFVLARHSWQWSGERYPPRMCFNDSNTTPFNTTFVLEA